MILSVFFKAVQVESGGSPDVTWSSRTKVQLVEPDQRQLVVW
jgi:hypothetical protein